MRAAIRGAAVFAVGLGMSGLLVGCVGDDGIPHLPPTPSATPIFASEEEALAAAEEAYSAYLEMSNLIASEGGVGADRISPFVTAERLDRELESSKTLLDRQLRIVGQSTFETLDLQRAEYGPSDAEVVLYVCWDGSQTRVINSADEDVTPTDRELRLVLEVVMETNDSKQLVLQSDEAWPDQSC